MSELTYADRELLLRTLDLLKSGWEGPDEEILEAACEWARRLSPSFGFEYGLTRDLAVLSRYLVDNRADADIADIARGGLLYVLRANQHGPARLGEFGLLDDAFILSYAVHEIRTRLSQPATYTPPRLTQAEQERAEILFLELLERPVFSDHALINASNKVGQSLGNLAVSGIFRRLQKNVEFLASVLRRPDFTPEQRSYARAALGYLVCTEDAIDDRLGIVGYLDDNFVAQMAVDLIEPTREPWLALLDATVGAWPFLNGLLIDDGTGARPVSEYAVINSALTCRQLRGQNAVTTTLVVPVSGPLPFLLGFVATLGLVQESGQRDVTEGDFRSGQKVLVDNCAIAEFAGYETSNGRRMFKLRQYYTERGQRLETVRHWPISDLRRLIPVDPNRVPRGQLTYDLSRNEALLPALEYLFNASKTADLAAVSRLTVVVMPVALAHELATTLSLHGHPMKDVVPMGHLTGDGMTSWSSRFGKQEPLLVIASDLDAACRFAEERDGVDVLVIIDLQGRNAAKTASLRRLRHFGIPTLVVSAHRAAEESVVADGEAGIWEWSEDDLDSLLWPANENGNGSGILAGYERRLQSLPSCECQIHQIPLDPANRTFGAVRTIQMLARERGDEHLVDLDEIVTLCYSLMSRLLRCATPLVPAVASFAEVENGLTELAAIRDRCRYLTHKEREATREAELLLRELFSALCLENPKARLVRALLSAESQLSLIYPDARLLPEVEEAYGSSSARVLASYGEGLPPLDGAIIPGWFRGDRMAALLNPPVTSPIHLVLYGIEQKWYISFRREKQKARAARAAMGGRDRIFPNVQGWRKPNQDSVAAHPDRDAGLQELEAIQAYVRSGYKQRVYSSARSDGTEAELPARLLVFDGGAVAFLTETHRANVVTHLLESEISDDKADVRQKRVSELAVGDALLFNRGSDRDVIRTAADRILPPGIRDTSSCWRDALLDYAACEGLTTEQVHEQLRQGGCPLQHQTIRVWLQDDSIIGPQAYKRDVGIVAKVTGDESLTAQMDDVLSAISQVRSAHLRASNQLAKQVLARAVSILRTQEHSSLTELEENVVVVRLVEIDEETVMVRSSLCNRLLEAGPWRE